MTLNQHENDSHQSYHRSSANDLMLDLEGSIIWESDPYGLNIFNITNSAFELLRYPSYQKVLEPAFLERHVHQDDFPYLLKSIYQAFANRESKICIHRMVRMDQSEFWVQTVLYAQESEGDLPVIRGITTDVSSLKKTVDSLKQSEEYYRKLADSVQDFAVFRVSPSGMVETWNLGAQRLKGYKPHEIIGSTLSIFFPKDGHKTLESLMVTASLKGNSTYEGWLIRKGGSRFWGLVTLSPIEDEYGQVKGFTNIARDLTERKRIEDSLRENEERLKQLIESVQDYAVFRMSSEGIVQDWNPGAQRLKDYRTKEIVGRSFANFFPASEIEKNTPKILLKKAVDEGRAEYEGWIIRKNGTRIWTLVTISAIIDEEGQLGGYSYIARDITERMQNEKNQTFLADVGIVLGQTLNFESSLSRMVNLVVPRMADMCAVYLLNDDHSLRRITYSPITPENVRIIYELDQGPGFSITDESGPGAVMRTGKPVLYDHFDKRTLDAFGQTHAFSQTIERLGIVSAMIVPLVTRGKTIGAICFHMSESNRRFGMNDLRLAVELADRSALAVENAQLYEKTQRAVQLREEVLAIVSHDLKNPLQIIQMSSDQIVNNLQKAKYESANKYIDKIRSASFRMDQLIRDLLDFASIEAGTLRIERKDCQVDQLIMEVYESYHQLAEENKIQLNHVIKGSPQTIIHCDRGRIIQVFSNLLGNAIKYTNPNGSITITADLERRPFEFSVGDTGRGIASHDLPFVFDRYWHGKFTARENIGLGLAITKAIIEAHDGKIWVKSNPGKGTCFQFTLSPD